MYMYDGVDLVATGSVGSKIEPTVMSARFFFSFFSHFFSLFLRLDYTCQCFTDPFWGSPTL